MAGHGLHLDEKHNNVMGKHCMKKRNILTQIVKYPVLQECPIVVLKSNCPAGLDLNQMNVSLSSLMDIHYFA